MKRIVRKLGINGLVVIFLVLALTSGAVYAYTVLTVTSNVEVLEPIHISEVAGDGTFDMDSNTWDTGPIYPASEPSITITFANAAPGAITLTLQVNPSSLDGGNLVFSLDNETLELPAEGTASVVLTATTNQSLTPGNYSTKVTVER